MDKKTLDIIFELLQKGRFDLSGADAVVVTRVLATVKAEIEKLEENEQVEEPSKED